MKINKNRICKILVITQLVLLSFVLNVNLRSETKMSTSLQNQGIMLQKEENEDDILDSFQNDDDLVPDTNDIPNTNTSNSELENFIQRREKKNDVLSNKNYRYKDDKEKDKTQQEKDTAFKNEKAQQLQKKRFHAASPERISGSFRAFREKEGKVGDTFNQFLVFLKKESELATNKYHAIKKSNETPWDFKKI